MTEVLISGGGIAGLCLGLTLHQISVPFHIFETSRKIKPLGVGINLQPSAVRELIALGLQHVLEDIGVETKDYGFYTKTGLEIWTEPRGRHAGYNWPQFSVHRGRLQMALYDSLLERAGQSCISTGHRLIGYQTYGDHITAEFETETGARRAKGALLIGADGIHSTVRAQMHPNEGPPVWSGAIMWRATTPAESFLSGASMILAGNDTERFVAYPISNPDPVTGLSTINWIAETSVDPTTPVDQEDWNREVSKDRFDHVFKNWNFGWINAPALIEGAETVFEYPMIDREPLEQWRHGRATLIGDAAHATYPVGSSGASQAIVDTRVLGAALRNHGATIEALDAYEAIIRPIVNQVTRANRARKGPDAIMQMAEDSCAGDFSLLEKTLPYEKRAEHAENFKKLAGLDIETINTRPPIIDLA